MQQQQLSALLEWVHLAEALTQLFSVAQLLLQVVRLEEDHLVELYGKHNGSHYMVTRSWLGILAYYKMCNN